MIGTPEIILITIIFIIVFGVAKIPELAKSIGKAYGEFRKGKLEVEKEIKELEVETYGNNNTRTS